MFGAAAGGFLYQNNVVALPGQVQYTSPGGYTWTVPDGVTSISAVCVGAGGSGSQHTTAGGFYRGGGGGGGGGLAWINNFSVTPGQTLFIGINSSESYISEIAGINVYVKGSAGGSASGRTAGAGGAYYVKPGLSGGGGAGGAGGTTTLNTRAGGGGGAGGYTGAGGAGGSGIVIVRYRYS